jgi:hypothetical protein
MQINEVVFGLAAGVGVDLSPDGKTAYYVEWSIGELSKVEVVTGKVTTVWTGLHFPEDVEVDWQTQEIFVSERTGAVVRVWPGETAQSIAKPGGAPQQLDLKRKGGTRYLYTVGYDSGELVRIDVDAKTSVTVASGLGHPVGLVVDDAQDFAYVTEQDKAALTRVQLANGSTTQLCTGLVSPFFLAWDKDRQGIFCVQRDPANSLVWLDLGAPGAVKTVASGLAWRPSGVAPNVDDTLIYICADQELEVISWNGVKPIRRPRPPFDIQSIQFYDEESGAIGLKHHLTGAPVALPEYVRGVRSEPAAYVVRTLPRIRVVLRKRAAYTGGAYAIGATGSLGGVRRKVVTPVFHASGLSDPIQFELMWPLPATVGKPDITFDWYARRSPGPSVATSLGSTKHRLYLLIDRPTAPWVAETPWVAALEIACDWAAGAADADAAATRVTERYYNCGVLKYDDINGATFYGNSTYMLSEMIDRLNGGAGLGQKVNCTDSANTVSTLSNLLGCDLWQCRMGWYFDLNPILAIGYPPPVPWPQWSSFSYHEVPWKGACTQNDRLFDGCLMVDGDNDPTSAPHAWLLPTNVLFGDCTTMNYRLRLCPPGASGCTACQPQPATTRQRRPIG